MIDIPAVVIVMRIRFIDFNLSDDPTCNSLTCKPKLMSVNVRGLGI